MTHYKLLVRNEDIADKWFAISDERNAQVKLKVNRHDWVPACGSESNARRFVDRNRRDMGNFSQIGNACIAGGFDVNVIVDDGNEYKWGEFFS
jgi:hypothetical protein